MIFCRLRQVSSSASIVNQVYGFGPTLKLLICLSSCASWLKSCSAALSDALNWSCASRNAYNMPTANMWINNEKYLTINNLTKVSAAETSPNTLFSWHTLLERRCVHKEISRDKYLEKMPSSTCSYLGRNSVHHCTNEISQLSNNIPTPFLWLFPVFPSLFFYRLFQ